MTIRLTDPQHDRYARFRLIRWWDQNKLAAARILVVGGGALGNEVVKNLALLGVGSVTILDFDEIETSNLTRSALFRPGDEGKNKAETLAKRAKEIHPAGRFRAMKADVRFDLGLRFLSSMDLIFGCLDNREARYYLNRACYLLRKTWIDGGLDTLNGSLMVFKPPETACYECTLTSADRAELSKRISCLKSTEPETKEHIPTAPTISSVIAGLQTQIGIRAIHGLTIPSGKRIGLYGLTDLFFEIQMEISNDCGLHSAADPLPETLQWLPCGEDAPLSEVLQAANKAWQADSLTWDFDRNLITSLACTQCGETKEFVGTENMYRESSTCGCGGVLKPTISLSYSGSEPWGSKGYRSLGFPAEHICCATTPTGRVYFTLVKE
ncbi:MAG TPA: ThiF family adenylyltransferase [Acidobacteriota bacterium]|nr:ThiF family adenylyltransferase [Acidobacteriota bacterium]